MTGPGLMAASAAGARRGALPAAMIVCPVCLSLPVRPSPVGFVRLCDCRRLEWGVVGFWWFGECPDDPRMSAKVGSDGTLHAQRDGTYWILNGHARAEFVHDLVRRALVGAVMGS